LIFLNRNSIETPTGGFVRNIFLCKSVDNCILKVLFGSLGFKKMDAKFKMASEIFIFVVLLSILQFLTDFKNIECIQRVFLTSNLSIFFFSKIQNGGFFDDDVIFEKNLTFFHKGPTLKRPKIYQKFLPKKTFQDGGYFQNGVCTFFLCECVL
jgi:hypothetical protein